MKIKKEKFKHENMGRKLKTFINKSYSALFINSVYDTLKLIL